jgi:hypothetical protein
MRGRDSREGIRKKGEDLEGGLSFGENFGSRRQGGNSGREGEGGGDWRTKIVLGNFYRGTVVAGNFGFRGQETEGILELGSRRGCS